jgi:hypothetical protein
MEINKYKDSVRDIPLLSSFEYMSQVYAFKSRNVTIGPVALYILEKFVEKPHFSAYQMWVTLKKTPFKMNYKNVHKRFQRMSKLDLIKPTGFKDSKRRAIYYRLTPGGVFYFLQYWHSAFVIFVGKQLVENYGNDNAFQTLLYPYISNKTIKDLTGAAMKYRILEYLRECCKEIHHILNKMEEERADYNTVLPWIGHDKKIHYATMLTQRLQSTIRTRFMRHLIYDLVCFPKKENTTDIAILANDNTFSMLVDEMKSQFNSHYEKFTDFRGK